MDISGSPHPGPRQLQPPPGGKLRLHTEVETQCTVRPVHTPHGRSWRPAWKIHT